MAVLDIDHAQILANLFHLFEKANGFPKLRPIAEAAMKHLEEYAEALLEGPKKEEPPAAVEEPMEE